MVSTSEKPRDWMWAKSARRRLVAQQTEARAAKYCATHAAAKSHQRQHNEQAATAENVAGIVVSDADVDDIRHHQGTNRSKKRFKHFKKAAPAGSPAGAPLEVGVETRARENLSFPMGWDQFVPLAYHTRRKKERCKWRRAVLFILQNMGRSAAVTHPDRGALPAPFSTPCRSRKKPGSEELGFFVPQSLGFSVEVSGDLIGLDDIDKGVGVDFPHGAGDLLDLVAIDDRVDEIPLLAVVEPGARGRGWRCGGWWS